MQSPKHSHLDVVFRMIKYVKKQLGLGVFLSSKSNTEMFAFCDYDCTTCVENRKTISGYSNKISDSLVSWKGKKKQYTRSRSSIKA